MKCTRITFLVPLGDSVEMEVDVGCRLESGDVWQPSEVFECEIFYTGQSRTKWWFYRAETMYDTQLLADVRLELVAYLADDEVGMGMFQRACADAEATPVNHGG